MLKHFCRLLVHLTRFNGSNRHKIEVSKCRLETLYKKYSITIQSNPFGFSTEIKISMITHSFLLNRPCMAYLTLSHRIIYL